MEQMHGWQRCSQVSKQAHTKAPISHRTAPFNIKSWLRRSHYKGIMARTSKLALPRSSLSTTLLWWTPQEMNCCFSDVITWHFHCYETCVRAHKLMSRHNTPCIMRRLLYQLALAAPQLKLQCGTLMKYVVFKYLSKPSPCCDSMTMDR